MNMRDTAARSDEATEPALNEGARARAGISPQEVTLWAGDLCVACEPTRLTTVLGSCVAVCLYDRTRRYGGMNHFLLPTGGVSARHGDWSTARLVEQMLEKGSARADLRAKLFGGATSAAMKAGAWAVGAENVRVARNTLHDAGVPILRERLGTTVGMRIVFENWTGVVWVKPHEEVLRG